MIPRLINSIFTLAIITIAAVSIGAEDKPADDIKQFTGISIVGDKEAPRSLYIVPWQNAELKQNTSLSSNLVDKNMHAVDRQSIQQQLQLYELSKSGWYRLTPDTP